MVDQCLIRLLLDWEQLPSEKLRSSEIQLLTLVKPKMQSEKWLAKKLKTDTLLVSPIVTGLMLRGYVETFRRRRLYFFHREYVVITDEGVGALERAKSPVQNIIDLIRERANETIDKMAASSPSLKVLFMIARGIYTIASH